MGSSWWRRRQVLLILCMLLPFSWGCFSDERAALMEIRASLVRANSTSTVPPPPWGEADDDCCSWKRVRCSNATRRVSHLYLSEVHVAPNPGVLPAWTWSLDTTIFAAFLELQFLDLSSNRPMALLSFDGLKNLSNLRELHLSSNSISGNLPSFLFSLPQIEILDLSRNMIEGPIPIRPSSNLSLSLKSLRLSHNKLSGKFSFFWLNNLSNLVEIDLSGNTNLGVNLINIPRWVPRFQLKHLLLSGCDLDKDIIAKPKFLGTQHQLEDLDLSNNNLSGGMPNWLFTKGSTLVNLNLRNNSLTGSLDPIKYPQTSLQYIDISMNHIVGQLPANISLVFPSMIIIDVSNNNFSGEIPMSLCHISVTQSLQLSNNKFAGEMPACLFTDLPNLQILRVANNHLGGPILGGRNNLSIGFAMNLGGNKFEGELPRNLSGKLLIMELYENKLTGELAVSSWNLSSLELLNVAGNYMTGEIHPQICDLQSIAYLDLSNNRFTGPIIRSCNNTSLMSLNMSMNSLSGDVSWEHFNMSNLVNLDVRHNMLTGNLYWVRHLPMIRVLSVGHNKFHGQIPPSLCELRLLRIIDLSHNKLSGPVPPCLGAMPFNDTSAFIIFQQVFRVHYTVTLEPEWSFTFTTKGMQLTYGPSNVALMSGIDLSGNLLSGEIPWELGKLSHLKFLNLSRNALVGPIPTSLANMSEMESLDLSHNELTGAIPPELTRLQSLAVFSVAYNLLSGCVPSYGQLGTFGSESYDGNNQLVMDCSSSPGGLESGLVPPRDEIVVDAGPYVAGAASFVMTFLATVVFSFFHSTGRRMVLKL